MEYVCTGAVLKCTMGTSTTKLKATPKNVSLVGKDQANIADFVSMVNVPSFGRCRSLAYPPTAAATAANHGRLTPMPCVPGTCPFWTAVDRNSLVCGQPALLKAAKLSCTFGGIISIVSPGQNKEVKAGALSLKASGDNQQELDQKIPDELLQEFNSLEAEGLDEGAILDGIQLALDVAGMVPLAGAAADLLNASISVLRGDWVGAGLSLVSAVPGVGDAVGGAKLAYKGAKLATKASKSVKTGTKVAKASDAAKIGTSKSVKQKAAVGMKNESVSSKQSNVVSINSRRVKIDNENGMVTKGSDNVRYQSFDDLSKHKSKIKRKEKQVEVRKVANEKYPDKYNVRVETQTQVTNSTGKVGGGTNSSPSGMVNASNVQDVKSTLGVTDKKQSPNSIFEIQKQSRIDDNVVNIKTVRDKSKDTTVDLPTGGPKQEFGI